MLKIEDDGTRVWDRPHPWIHGIWHTLNADTHWRVSECPRCKLEVKKIRKVGIKPGQYINFRIVAFRRPGHEWVKRSEQKLPICLPYVKTSEGVIEGADQAENK